MESADPEGEPQMCDFCEMTEVDQWGHCARCDARHEATALAAYRAAIAADQQAQHTPIQEMPDAQAHH